MSDDPASIDAFKWECRRKQVESLRIPWEGMGAMANAERHIAALMIENLMEEVEAWKKAMQKAERDIMQLRQQVTDLLGERDEARRELSAARRELCRNEAIIRLQRHRVHRDSEDVVGMAKEIAVERGWDCFKEQP